MTGVSGVPPRIRTSSYARRPTAVRGSSASATEHRPDPVLTACCKVRFTSLLGQPVAVRGRRRPTGKARNGETEDDRKGVQDEQFLGALSSEGLSFSLPAGTLIAFVVVAVTAGILAAIAPARRAAKLDVLAALQTQ